MLQEHFRKDVVVGYKGDIDQVTEFDHLAENLIAEILLGAYPDYGLLGEEDHQQYTPGQAFWVVDPLDGTTNYTRGLSLFAVSIALVEDGESRLGVVYSPVLDELFVAQKGQGASLNGQPIQVSDTAELGKALLSSGFPYDAWTSERDNLAEWGKFTKRAMSPRSDGCASLDLCYVGAGRYDGYWELSLEPWDMAAGALVVMEAGGVVTDIAGEPFDPLGRTVLVANPAIHALMLDCLVD
jgi:myo-inositol-1(or 4)-monophosphatase